MLFNSALFLFFFAGVAAALYATPPTLRWIVLFVASIIFYASWDYRYLLIIFAIAAVAYVFGHCRQHLDESSGRWALAITVILILLPLAFFKYANFFLANVGPLFGPLGSSLPNQIRGIVLPLGISFYTFQLLSYCVDVHTGRYTPGESFARLL